MTFPSFQDIKNYIQGNYNSLLLKYNSLEDHIKEQALYRLNKSNPECFKQGNCIKCGCAFPKMVFSPGKECADCGWGFMMNKQEWEDFKNHETNIDYDRLDEVP